MPHASSRDTDALQPPSAHPHPDLNTIPTASANGEPSQHIHAAGICSCVTPDNSDVGQYRRRQSQASNLAKKVATNSMTTKWLSNEADHARRTSEEEKMDELRNELGRTLSGTPQLNALSNAHSLGPTPPKPVPMPMVRQHSSLAAAMNGTLSGNSGASRAMNDTPATTAPGSPSINGDYFPHHDESNSIKLGPPARRTSGTNTPRVRPTTLDIPGLTKSKVSPDGRIAQRDVGAKLVIVMVGLPARGKSYITKKLARYLNWLQHDTKIFNVGERRRNVAGGPTSERSRSGSHQPSFSTTQPLGLIEHGVSHSPEQAARRPLNVASIILNGETKLEAPATPQSTTPSSQLPNGTHTDHERQDGERHIVMPDMGEPKSPVQSRVEACAIEEPQGPEDESMEQNSAFFDPDNKKASQIREQVARETLDELLDYILYKNGSVGILDATNSTAERRKMVMERIRERAGPDLNVLFLESRCVDENLLEANMRLKLCGPDYKDMDPHVALEDFRKRIQVYEKAYVPLGEYEEKLGMPYIQMIDVGRKIISHQIKGFLMAQANYYLLNFNLAPRQIWITRHGLSEDNISGKIGGDSDLAEEGVRYARSLAAFMEEKRREWDVKQIADMQNTHFPPQPGDATPPNPYYHPPSPKLERRNPFSPGAESAPSSGVRTPDSTTMPEYEPKPFCVWTSMLKRSIQTAQYFNDEEYDIKQMRMLDELNAGMMEGLTYGCISTQYPAEYRARKEDKLHYRYPGPGGEGYLDIINRLRPVIVELERMTDHVLLVGHRSVARVLLAYFRGLGREEVADLDVPLGMLYCLEPRPYGVEFKAYKWDKDSEWFYEVPNFQLTRMAEDMQ
ncbi:6-phosphofructo-2-kinase [Elasticomyces elasticus]|nr:6-phosphofructo-2-kinase [Elasticomyces elasticus]KAK3653548.1 6-phosphofructo-2-kinase [Elasticomyces elasticus]KAK4919147.1 6-phosphofructo-2-kinase [Elasticomyces elasticus]KAK5753199.1 6-phosphofructo-2-kinase [Elasticomyces elasticus]